MSEVKREIEIERGGKRGRGERKKEHERDREA